MLKQLLHEADHSPLFSAEVADQCSCNCAFAECLHGVHRGDYLLPLCLRYDFNVYVDVILPYRK